jgi:hypothetical protein
VGALPALTGNQGHRCGADEAAAGHVLPIPINEVGKRTGDQFYRGHEPGSGIGKPGDPAYTILTDSRQGVAQPLAPLAFPANLSSTQVASTRDLSPALEAKNPTAVVQSTEPFAMDLVQVTSPTNMSRCIPGGPAPILAQTSQVVVGEPLAFTCKDHGQDVSVGVSPTMRAMNGEHANAGGQLATCQPPGWLVRRMMPCEYEDLQGMWPDHTGILIKGKVADDGPRYKACGNAWARNVFEWLGRRISAAHTAVT